MGKDQVMTFKTRPSSVITVVVAIATLIVSSSAFAQSGTTPLLIPGDTHGTTWTKYESNPIITQGPSGSWDSNSISSGQVIYDGQIYSMWYSGNNGVIEQIGLATSLDGKNWTKYAGNPVLITGA